MCTQCTLYSSSVLFFWCFYLYNVHINECTFYIQPVSHKRYFRCNNCVLLLVYAINLSLSTDLVDPYGENTFSMKPPLFDKPIIQVHITKKELTRTNSSRNTYKNKQLLYEILQTFCFFISLNVLCVIMHSKW